jgi:hypothetical protein
MDDPITIQVGYQSLNNNTINLKYRKSNINNFNLKILITS